MRWSFFGLVSLMSLFAAVPQASAAEDYAVLIISRERLEVPTNCEIGLYIQDQLAGRLSSSFMAFFKNQYKKVVFRCRNGIEKSKTNVV